MSGRPELKEARAETIEISRMKIPDYDFRKDLQPGDLEYENLKLSLDTFGKVLPIVWNERTGNIVGGRQIFKIALNEFNVWKLNVSVVDMDPDMEKLLAVTLDNNEGIFDHEALVIFMKQLNETGLDLTVTGFSQKELDKMFEETITALNANEEFSLDDFGDDTFQCECPKCGFRFTPGGD